MFTFKTYSPGILPIAKESQDDISTSERDSMLDHEYQKPTPRSRTRRILTSNVPWILTTAALSVYIFVSRSSQSRNNVPWSPTDVGKFVGNTITRLISKCLPATSSTSPLRRLRQDWTTTTRIIRCSIHRQMAVNILDSPVLRSMRRGIILQAVS